MVHKKYDAGEWMVATFNAVNLVAIHEAVGFVFPIYHKAGKVVGFETTRETTKRKSREMTAAEQQLVQNTLVSLGVV